MTIPRSTPVNLTTLLAIFFLAAPTFAQMPARAPELKKLDYFVGTWTTDGTIYPGPWGAGGKMTATATTDWMAGDFFLVRHSDAKMPAELGGDNTETAYFGYDAAKGVYTFDEFNSAGRRYISQGTLSGDTWTWTSSQNYQGQEVQQKVTVKIASPALYNVKFEVSVDGANWMTFMDAKVTKK
jgi:Protein of unknown function (DUF1579)